MKNLLDTNDPKIKKLIEERTERLSANIIGAAESSHDVNLMCFLINSEVWAVPIDKIIEIFPVCNITRIPNAPRHVIGLCNLRGTVLSVIDIGGVLGLGITTVNNKSQVVVIDSDGQDLAFVTDRLIDIVTVPQDTIQQPLWVLDKIQGDAVSGEVMIGEQLLGILDITNIFQGRQ